MLALEGEARTKALRLFLLGNNRPAIAKRLRVERAVVVRTIAEAEASGLLPKVRERMKAMLSGLLEDVVIEKAKNPKKVTVREWGMMFDRLQLLEGQATSITMEIKPDNEDQLKILARLQNASVGLIEASGTDERNGSQAGQSDEAKGALSD